MHRPTGGNPHDDRPARNDSATPASGATRVRPPTGPLGKVRSPVTVILLTIVTLGIYHFFWIYYVYKELKDHTDQGIGGVIGLVIALVIGS